MATLKLSDPVAVRRRVYLFLVDATDGLTPETAEAGGQPQISKNGAAFANTTATLVAVGNGTYYVELTTTELDTIGTIRIRFKSANTAEFSESHQVSLNPYADHMILAIGTATAGAAGSITLAVGSPWTVNNQITGNLVAIIAGTGLGQTRYIGTYTQSTRVALVTVNWIVTPDATSQYAIIATHNFVFLNNSSINSNTFVANAINANALATDTITAAKIATDAITAAKVAADAVTEIQAGLATAADVTAIKAKTDNLPTNTASEIGALQGLLHQNSMIDNTVYNVDGLLTSARVRVFASSAALTAAVAGAADGANSEIFRFLITATVGGGNMTTYKLARQL